MHFRPDFTAGYAAGAVGGVEEEGGERKERSLVPEPTRQVEEAQEDTNVFRAPGTLLPTHHGLPQFPSAAAAAAAMGDSLCSFHANDTRWATAGMPGVSQLQLPPALGRQQAMPSPCPSAASAPGRRPTPWVYPTCRRTAPGCSHTCTSPRSPGWYPPPYPAPPT
ncbi:hypothetical protein INR49_022479 [Caranx melampygus]|nr:hypothetical protein INR49_022479 [Caranx melampygus]